MHESDLKNNLYFEKKIENLENKLKIRDTLIENILKGDIEKAKKSLNNYKNESEFSLLNDLVEKFSDRAPENAQDIKDETAYAFLKVIIEGMPFPVFIKDENAKYCIINTFEADLFGLQESEILGKHDSDFIENPEEIEIIRKSDTKVLVKNKSVKLPNQSFSLPNGRSYVFKTHKIPFINPITRKRNILGFSVDVTDTINLDNLRKLIMSKL